MTALIVIGSILLFFALILSLKGTLTVAYNGEIEMFVRVLFIKIKILPSKKKGKGPHSMSEKKAKKIKQRLEAKKEKKRLKKKQKSDKKKSAKQAPKEKKSLSEILGIISTVKSIVGVVTKRFFGHLKVKVARLKITVATGDAASTAIAYGAVSQAAMYLYELLEPLKGFTFPKENQTEITCDYLSDKSTIDIKISFSLRVWHLFHVAFGALGELIRYKIKNQNKT